MSLETESHRPQIENDIPVYTLTIFGQRTSVRLHALERAVLKRICDIEKISPSTFCERAISDHGERNRSASLRLALLNYMTERAPEFAAEAHTALIPVSGQEGSKSAAREAQ